MLCSISKEICRNIYFKLILKNTVEIVNEVGTLFENLNGCTVFSKKEFVTWVFLIKSLNIILES